MSCGPSEKLKALADQVDALDDKIDSLITESPLGKLNDLKNQAGDAVNGVMGKLTDAIPEALTKIGDIADRTLHEDVSDIAKLLLLGIAGKDLYEREITRLTNKWGNISFCLLYTSDAADE